MVHTNIQSPVTLTGSGFVNKISGDYQNGEYRHLSNIDLGTDGTLVSRQNINVAGSHRNLTNPSRFVGYFDNYAVVTTNTQQYFFSNDSSHASQIGWDPTDLPLFDVYSTHDIVGTFTYNKTLYWITQEFRSGLTTVINLYYKPYVWSDNFSSIAFGDLTHEQIIVGSDIDEQFKTFFIHKERLWVATNKKIYFGKATDPTNFTVPDGGFFVADSEVINDAVAVFDTINIFSDNSTFALTYEIDPNSDSTLRRVADVGGYSACIHANVPYFINNQGIWAVNGNDVDKVRESFHNINNNAYDYKIRSFDKYLVVLARTIRGYAGPVPYYNSLNARPCYYGVTDKSRSQYCAFMLNADTGSLFALEFQDQLDAEVKGEIVDIMYLPTRNFFRTSKLFILTSTAQGSSIVPDRPFNFKGNVYHYDTSRSGFIFDNVVKSNGTTAKYRPKYDLYIDSFVPDGNEYLIKKFRHVEFMGMLHSRNIEISLGFDNKPMSIFKYIDEPFRVFDDYRPHFPFRVGFNQRGRSLSIRIKSTDTNTPLLEVSDDLSEKTFGSLQLSEMRVVWSYTNRSTETQYPTSSATFK